MQWPANPQEGEWYLKIVPAKGKSSTTSSALKFDEVFIVVRCKGFEQSCDFASVSLVSNPSFGWQFDNAIKGAIEAVQKMNMKEVFDKETELDPDNTCAECGEMALRNDYLCREHRSSK